MIPDSSSKVARTSSEMLNESWVTTVTVAPATSSVASVAPVVGVPGASLAGAVGSASPPQAAARRAAVARAVTVRSGKRRFIGQVPGRRA